MTQAAMMPFTAEVDSPVPSASNHRGSYIVGWTEFEGYTHVFLTASFGHQAAYVMPTSIKCDRQWFCLKVHQFRQS